MKTARWGEQQSMLLDQVKEALDERSALSIRLRVAARAAFGGRSVDLEFAAIPPALQPRLHDGP